MSGCRFFFACLMTYQTIGDAGNPPPNVNSDPASEAKTTQGFNRGTEFAGLGAVTTLAPKVAEESSASTRMQCASCICVVLLCGFIFAWGCTDGPFRRCAEYVGYICAMLHIPMQWLPLLSLRTLMMESDNCTSGLNWRTHVMYAVVLALASPVLTMSIRGSMQNGRLQFLARCEHLSRALFPPYLYAVSIISAADQYLDAAMTAAALECQWRLSWLMLLVYFMAFVAQAYASCLAKDTLGLCYSLMGVSPEAYALAYGDEESTEEERLGFQAAVGFSRLLTENLPLGYLQMMFIHEAFENKWLAYCSLATSFSIGLKYFIFGVRYKFCHPSDYAAVSSQRPAPRGSRINRRPTAAELLEGG